jgi:5-formyltetrahydrofolate cyclo-ligase
MRCPKMSYSKKELRKIVKEKLESLSEMEVRHYNLLIQEKFFKSDSWNQAEVIGITVSRGREVETRDIIERAWKEGKKVSVPKCYPDNKSMAFYILNDFTQLEEVYFGLKEPKVDETVIVEKNDIELLIVPGVCYTLNGFRVGYGGGYYDRYLEHFHGNTVSLLFECQLVDGIPANEFDIPVKQIITEDRVINCNE